MILIISDLEELYEPWLSHDVHEENHPILSFILSRKIPTIIYGPGSIYEPSAKALNGAFGRLSPLVNGKSL